MSCDNIPKARDISGGFIYVNQKGFEHVSQENSATFKTKKISQIFLPEGTDVVRQNPVDFTHFFS